MKTKLRFIFSVLGLLIGIVFLGFYFKIKQVSCYIDQAEQNHAPVCQQLQTLVGSNILFRDLRTDQDVLAATVISATKEVFSLLEIETSLNGKVTFYLAQTPPLYRYVSGGEMRIFTETTDNRADDQTIVLPEIKEENNSFSQEFSHNHNFIVEFLKTLSETERQEIKEINFLSANKVRLVMINYLDFILDPQQEPIEQAKKFQVVYHQLKPNEIDLLLQEIDLRFELPVLKTYESSDSAEFLIDSPE